MISRINRLIGAILLVAASLYVVILNRDAITIRLTPSFEVTTSAGVIFIAIFCVGIICAACVGAFFGFRAYLRERQLKYRERLRESFYLSMLQARSALAAGELGRAKELWQQIIRREPSNIVARVELSRALEDSGDALDALKVLDAARAEAPDNVEVLLRAAEVNVALGNRTAAIDNLALSLYHKPSAKAAMLARDLSEEIDRIEDALEYHAQAQNLLPSHEAHAATLIRLKLKKLLKDLASSSGTSAGTLLKELRSFAKKHADHAICWETLATHELAANNHEEAAQAYVRAARLTARLDLWYKATEIWLSQRNPDRALAAVRAIAKDSRGIARVEAELALVRTYLSLSMFTEALQSLDQVPSLAVAQGCTLSPALRLEIALLRALALSSLQRPSEATSELLLVANHWHVFGSSSAALPEGSTVVAERTSPGGPFAGSPTGSLTTASPGTEITAQAEGRLGIAAAPSSTKRADSSSAPPPRLSTP
jgi:tetratricopeptide (TPR) repeat protein